MSINGGGFRDIPKPVPHSPLVNEVRPVNDALGGIYTPPMEKTCPVCNEIVAVGWGSPHFCLNRDDPRVKPNYPQRIYHNAPWETDVSKTIVTMGPPYGDTFAIAGAMTAALLTGLFFYRR